MKQSQSLPTQRLTRGNDCNGMFAYSPTMDIHGYLGGSRDEAAAAAAAAAAVEEVDDPECPPLQASLSVSPRLSMMEMSRYGCDASIDRPTSPPTRTSPPSRRSEVM